MKRLHLFLFLFCLLLAVPSQAKIIYVDANAPGANNGQNWANAYKYLQDALADASSAVKPVEIRVAQGVYTPDTSSADPNGSSDRTATFQLINGVAIYGSFPDGGGVWEERDPNDPNKTILSGDLNGDDGPDFADNGENSFHVVTGSGTDETAVLDGFTITAGNANGSRPNGNGGGMYNATGSPTLTNCTFSGNSAWYGGGMHNYWNNPTVTNCIFGGNSASGGGGMVNYAGSKPTLINCTFIGNSAGERGGGMCNEEGSSPTLTNCIFIGNSTERRGGGLWSRNSDLRITNCTFTGNVAEYGGAMYCGRWPPPGGQPPITEWVISNCILWGNSPEEIYVLAGVPVATYNDVQGGWPGEGNIDADPCFADANNGDYHLKSQAGRWDPNSQSWVQDDVTSPCIDAGNPGCPLGDEPNDLRNIRINMGAFGGTAEASKSPANWRNIADLTNDWVVDNNDLKVFVGYWLETGDCIPSDLDRSRSVDFTDFAIFGRQRSEPSASEPGMTFQIDDCDMEEGQSWPVAAESNEPRFSVWVEGRYIHFEDQMYANCCPDELGLDKEINGKQITLYEIGYGGMCDCMCYFPITATLGPFEDGTYTVEVFDNYGKSLGVVEVTIGGSTGPGITYQIEDCNQEAPALFSAEPPGQTRFTVTVDGQNILFEDMMTANCCPDGLGLEMVVEDNLITIYETEYTPGGCWCICDYPVTATLGPFEPGIYTLEVYEDWGGFIASITVVIAPPE